MKAFFFTGMQTFLLCAAVCIDTLAAAFGFGVEKIRIPTRSALILSGVSSAALALAMLGAVWISPLLPAAACTWLSFGLLTGIGLLKIFDSAIKRLIRKLPHAGKELAFSFMQIQFLLKVYADPAAADADRSQSISPAEAFALGLALSSDGIAAGLGSGFAGLPLIEVFLFSALLNLACIVGGSYLGRKAAGKFCNDLSWLGGVILLCMGISYLF